jgi:hypothetical protein
MIFAEALFLNYKVYLKGNCPLTVYIEAKSRNGKGSSRTIFNLLSHESSATILVVS